jgi:enoyl-CoA hydratase/carnithine racemase
MSLPAVSDALIPGMAPIRLPRLIGLGPARRLMLTGEELGAEEAYGLGLVDHVVPAGDPAALDAVLRTYLDAPRTASVALKKMLAMAFTPSVAAAADGVAALFDECVASPELTAASERWRERRHGARPAGAPR